MTEIHFSFDDFALTGDMINEIERCGTQEETINNLICQSRTKSLKGEVGTDILLPCVVHCSFATSQRDSTLKRIKG